MTITIIITFIWCWCCCINTHQSICITWSIYLFIIIQWYIHICTYWLSPHFVHSIPSSFGSNNLLWHRLHSYPSIHTTYMCIYILLDMLMYHHILHSQLYLLYIEHIDWLWSSDDCIAFDQHIEYIMLLYLFIYHAIHSQLSLRCVGSSSLTSYDAQSMIWITIFV